MTLENLKGKDALKILRICVEAGIRTEMNTKKILNQIVRGEKHGTIRKSELEKNFPQGIDTQGIIIRVNSKELRYIDTN